MGQSKYSVNTEKLHEYVEQLKDLEAQFAQKIVVKKSTSKDCGKVHDKIGIITEHISNTQMQLESLIYNTINYMEKIEKTVVENDERTCKKIENS